MKRSVVREAIVEILQNSDLTDFYVIADNILNEFEKKELMVPPSHHNCGSICGGCCECWGSWEDEK